MLGCLLHLRQLSDSLVKRFLVVSADVPFFNQQFDELKQLTRFLRFYIHNQIDIPLHVGANVSDLPYRVDCTLSLIASISW